MIISRLAPQSLYPIEDAPRVPGRGAKLQVLVSDHLLVGGEVVDAGGLSGGGRHIVQRRLFRGRSGRGGRGEERTFKSKEIVDL